MSLAHVLVDLAYGDSGKGSMTDYLVRKNEADLVVRYNGGPQASHHVVLPDGRWHGFSQFGAGTFAGAKTYLSEYMLFEPYAFVNEASDLVAKGIDRPFSMVTINERAIVITPWHWMMNQLRETARGAERHGSCGFGVGEARADELERSFIIRVNDMSDCLNRLKFIKEHKIAEAERLGYDASEMIAENPGKVQADYRFMRTVMNVVSEMPEVSGNVVFEGAQGVLLDERWGWAPYNTWTDTTTNNAMSLIRDANFESVEVTGIVPAVMTRHGRGPFVSEVADRKLVPFRHNRLNEWQGPVRVGRLDTVAIRYALRHCRVDNIALTMCDLGYLPLEIVNQYELDQHELGGALAYDIPDDLSASILLRCEPRLHVVDSWGEIARWLQTPIKYGSFGPTFEDKREAMAIRIC